MSIDRYEVKNGFTIAHSMGRWVRADEALARIYELEKENAALRTALADAISSPMGVVPASAEQFYDQTKGTVKP